MESKFNSASGPCAMPEKMNITRAHAGQVGYQQARTSRGQVGTSRNVGVLTDQHGKAVAEPGVTLQPKPTDAPSFPKEENGMAPDQVIADPNDAQGQQVHQPPIEETTEKPEPIETSAEPPSGENRPSDPVPGDADPGPTGGSAKPGYASLLNEEVNHPTGYSGN